MSGNTRPSGGSLDNPCI